MSQYWYKSSRNRGGFLLWATVILAGAGSIVYFVIEQSKEEIVFRVNESSVPEKIKKPPQHISTPDEVRALYMTSWVAGTPSLREGLLAFIEKSEINSLVIDIKDYTGKISFKTDDDIIRAMGSEEERIPDIQKLIERLHGNKIYVIGRISVFQDPFFARRNPDLAVQSVRGGIWRDRKGLSYIDPGAEKYWEYTVRIAKAAERVGFDELNFDYIRFPSDGPISQARYPFTKSIPKAEMLENFFKYLAQELRSLPVATSADLFGLTTINKDDLGIGQVLERAAPHFSYIAPMVYPSHYNVGFMGFKNPALHPYEVVYESVSKAGERLKNMGQDPKKLRPWLQDFDLGAPYGIAEISAQKKALLDAGLTSWMMWDPSNRYTQEAYQKK